MTYSGGSNAAPNFSTSAGAAGVVPSGSPAQAPAGYDPNQIQPFDPNANYAGSPDPVAQPSIYQPPVQGFAPPPTGSMDPNLVPRKIDPISVIGNAFLDVKDMGQGLSVMGSLAGARTLDLFHGQSPLRASDFTAVGQVAHGILDAYNNNYLQPILKGKPLDIGIHALQYPVSTFLDVNPVARGLKVGSALKALPGAARAFELAGTGGKTVSELTGRLVNAARDSEILGPLVGKVDAVVQKTGVGNEILKNQQANITPGTTALDQAFAKVPVEERPFLQAYAEGTHPEVIQNGYANLSPEVQNYLEVARRLMAQSTSNVLGLNRVTPHQVFVDRHLPALSAMRHLFGLSEEDVLALMNDPAQLDKALHMAKARLNAVGADPIYQGRMTAKEASRVNSAPLHIPAFTLRSAGAAARATTDEAAGLKGAANVTQTPKLGMEYARTALERAEKYSTDSHAVTRARFIQSTQLYSAYQVMLNRILKAAQKQVELTPELVEQLDKGTLTRFKPKAMFQRVLEGTFDQSVIKDMIEKTLPEEVIIPSSLVKAFEAIATQEPAQANKLFTGLANFARKYILGFNFAFPEQQAAQNFVMLGLTQFTGPRDAVVSLLSYALAMDEKINKLVPAELAGEFMDYTHLPEIVRGHALDTIARVDELRKLSTAHKAFHALKSIPAAAEKATAFTFWRTAVYDRYTRVAAAAYYAIKLSEKYPEFGGPIRAMINQGEAINRIEKVLANPQTQEQVAKQVLLTLGDYGALQSAKRAVLRSTFLWWNWYEAICKFTWSLPKSNPYKFTLFSRIAQQMPEAFQDSNLPTGLRKAGAVSVLGENDQGIPYFALKGGLNPFASITELAEMIAQPVEGNESSTVLGGMNPIFPFLTAQIFKINPQTGEEFHDPNLVQQGGKQYKYEDLLAGRNIEQKPSPNPIEYAARTLAPSPVRFAERLYAKATTGGEPSQFTSPIAGNPAARKLYNSGGEPLHAASYGELLLEQLIGIRAMPIDTSATQRIESMQAHGMQKAQKSAIRQLSGEERLEAYARAFPDNPPSQ